MITAVQPPGSLLALLACITCKKRNARTGDRRTRPHAHRRKFVSNQPSLAHLAHRSHFDSFVSRASFHPQPSPNSVGRLTALSPTHSVAQSPPVSALQPAFAVHANGSARASADGCDGPTPSPSIAIYHHHHLLLLLLPPSSSSAAAASTITRASQTLLVLWDDLPAWRCDNAFIRSGYRPTRASYRHALRSLFYLHNESVNIWSHLVGALFAGATALYLGCAIHPRYRAAQLADVIVFCCFFAGAVLCLGMSATYHALAAHSEKVARWGNKLDYTGIVALILGSYVPVLYYGFFCKPGLRTVYLSLICLVGIGCAAVSWIERFRTPAWRPYRAAMFISLGLLGVIPVLHSIVYGYQAVQDTMSFTWVVAQGVLYIFGAVLYAVRWPERSFPGTFDIWGSSHQIFHVFVLLAAVTHFYGMSRAFDHHHAVVGPRCEVL